MAETASDQQNPLAGLHDFDWSSVSHAYGPATDVPAQLEALNSSDPATSLNVFKDFCSNIYHQGSRYPASAIAVPFIVNIVLQPDCQHPGKVLSLLSLLACGHEAPYGFNIKALREETEDALQNGVARQAARYDNSIAKTEDKGMKEFWLSMKEGSQGKNEEYEDCKNSLDTYDAVRAHVGRLTLLLDHKNPIARIYAAHLLGWFPEEFDTAARALKHIVDTDKDNQFPTVTATALIAISLLCKYNPEKVVTYAPLFELHLSSTESWIRWASAAALVNIGRGSSNDMVFKVLIDSLKTAPSTTNDETDFTPYCNASDDEYTAGELTRLSLELDNVDETAPQILDVLETAKGIRYLDFAEISLALLFCEPLSSSRELDDLTLFNTLTVNQQRLLKIFMNSDQFFWSFANFLRLLDKYGIPSDLKSLKEYIGAQSLASLS